MTDEPEDIDLLMAKTDLTRPELDRIIAYQRKQRALREAGVKTRKSRGEAPPAVSLKELLDSVPKPKAVPGTKTFKRR